MAPWDKCAPLIEDSVLSCENVGGGGYEWETGCCTMDAAMAEGGGESGLESGKLRNCGTAR